MLPLIFGETNRFGPNSSEKSPGHPTLDASLAARDRPIITNVMILTLTS
jgi:hypothetical protein